MKDLQYDVRQLEHFLDQQGLVFKPLRAELLDHIISDVESRMSGGESFNDAWNTVRKEIPSDHFKNIQQQTMESIDNRFRISRIFSNLFLGLIILASLFKFMHLPGAGILMISSLAAIAISLSYGSIAGVVFNRTRKGSVWVITLIVGIVLLLLSFGFKIFQLPGVVFLAIAAVITLLFSMIGITLNIGKVNDHEDSLLSFLHDKHTPSIQRVLLILLSLGVILQISAIGKGADQFISNIIFLMVIFSAGIHLLVYFWRSLETDKSKKPISLLVIVSAICLFLPILNFYIPIEPRLFFGGAFYLVAGFLVYHLQPGSSNKSVTLLFLGINFLHFVCWSLIEVGVIAQQSIFLIYNIPFIVIYLLPFWFFRTERLMLTYWIICTASFGLQYSTTM